MISNQVPLGWKKQKSPNLNFLSLVLFDTEYTNYVDALKCTVIMTSISPSWHLFYCSQANPSFTKGLPFLSTLLLLQPQLQKARSPPLCPFQIPFTPLEPKLKFTSSSSSSTKPTRIGLEDRWQFQAYRVSRIRLDLPYIDQPPSPSVLETFCTSL